MPKRASKPKLQKHTKTSIKMVLPLMALTVVTGVILVASSFASSVYPSGYMNNLYSQAFGRGVDKSGQSHWNSYFQANGCSGASLANAAKQVYASNEFAGKLYNANDVVTRIYGGALQRQPDPSGLNYWVGKLNSGSSRANVAAGIINGGQSAINNIANSACAAPTPVTPTQPTTPTNPKPTTTTPKPTTTKPKPTTTTPATPTTPSTPADTQAPAKPSGFESSVDDESSAVTLSWDAAEESEGVSSYKLERSTDNGANWTVIDDTITDTEYVDRTVVFSTTYKYQLRAIDGAGNASEAVTTEIKTGEFSANATAEDATALASDDNVVIASLPAGAVPEDSSCSVTLDGDDVQQLKNTSTKLLILAGPYLISCKDSNGDVVSGFQKPVVVTMAPPTKATKGNTKFQIYTFDMQAEKWELAKSTYDKKSKTYKVTIDGPAQVAFVGQKKANYWPLFFSIVLPTLLIGGGAFWYYQRKLQKQQYADYIKKKYYNL